VPVELEVRELHVGEAPQQRPGDGAAAAAGVGFGVLGGRVLGGHDGLWVGARALWVEGAHQRCGVGAAAGSAFWACTLSAATTSLQISRRSSSTAASAIIISSHCPSHTRGQEGE